MKKINIIGERYGYLLVVKEAQREDSKKPIAYICICDCGNYTTVNARDLRSGNTQSCGCSKKKSKIDMVSKRFGRLLVIQEDHTARIRNKNHIYWKCICDCGKEVIIDGRQLRIGNTNSCGCLQRENGQKQSQIMGLAQRKYSPIQSSARQMYDASYSDGDLSFDDFWIKSQENCFYCNKSPSNRANPFNKEDGIFVYNGLDRINPSMEHNMQNIQPCCSQCNWAKGDLTVDDFLLHISSMVLYRQDRWNNDYNNIVIPVSETHVGMIKPLPKKDRTPFITAIRRAWHNYSPTKEETSNISFKAFLLFSQMNCYYCNAVPANAVKNIHTQERFSYNGLDKIIPSNGHIIGNVVPCCYPCNKMKSDYSLLEFDSWITNIYDNILIIKEKLQLFG